MKEMSERHYAILRRHMAEVIAIHADLAGEEIGKEALDERVMAAMQNVPRHAFVPEPLMVHAYQDTPLPIGFNKTISQPFIVALMTDLLSPAPDDTVLEIGTGLGYQAAILSQLARQVWTVEVIEEFAREAETLLGRLGYANIGIHIGDGSRGWAEHAPYDRIMVTAAAMEPPEPLLDQLKPGGRMVLPVGPTDSQRLTIIDKDEAGQFDFKKHIPVRFSELETVR